MKNTIRWAVICCAAAILVSLAAIAQEPAQPDAKQADQDAAVVQGLRWLTTQKRADLQFDSSLSVLLAANLVSSNDLGVDVAEVQPALRAQLNLPEGAGLAVTAVPEDGPAAKAGIKPHDVLLKVGDQAVGTTEQLSEALKKAEGQAVKIELLRQGKPIVVEVTPKSPRVAEIVLSDTPVTAWSSVKLQQEPRYRIGVVLSEADDTLRAQIGLATGEGLIVTEVFPDAPAAKVGIQPHDVLVILDGKRLSTVDAVNAQIQEIKDREVEVKILRGGKEMLLKLAPQKEGVEATFIHEANRALTIWSAGGCPAQVQTKSCQGCHVDPHAPDRVIGRFHDYDLLRSLFAKSRTAVGDSPQGQIDQLKDQLAKVQETLSALEASLQADAAKEEKQPMQEEKK